MDHLMFVDHKDTTSMVDFTEKGIQVLKFRFVHGGLWVVDIEKTLPPVQ